MAGTDRWSGKVNEAGSGWRYRRGKILVWSRNQNRIVVDAWFGGDVTGVATGRLLVWKWLDSGHERKVIFELPLGRLAVPVAVNAAPAVKTWDAYAYTRVSSVEAPGVQPLGQPCAAASVSSRQQLMTCELLVEMPVA